jgi:hypothetical protein
MRSGPPQTQAPQQPRSLTEKLNGSIGLVLCLCDLSAEYPEANGMRVWVKRVVPGSPADSSDVQPGHELRDLCGAIGAESVDVRELMASTQRLDKIAAILTGPVGSLCTLTLYDYGQGRRYKVTLERRLFYTPPLPKGAGVTSSARRSPRGGDGGGRGADEDYSFWGLLWGIVWGSVWSVVLGVLGLALLARLPQLTSLLPQSPHTPVKQLVYRFLQTTEPALLAFSSVLTIFAILVVRFASDGLWGSNSGPNKGHRDDRDPRGRNRGVLWQVGGVAAVLLMLCGMSYTLDHYLLWKVVTERGAGGEAVGGRARGVGGVLRGKVAVVLDGSRGVGFQVTRALQALGATVVMACPDRDTCARKTTALAAHFTPADGAWAITPMKLNMCSLPSIRAFAAAVSDKYARVDMLVLDSTSSCASNNSLSSSSLSSSSLSSSSPAAVRRVGDGSTCPQIFVAHTALVRWLGRLLVPQAPPHHNHTPSQYSSQAANSAASRDAGKNSQKSSSQSLLAASCSN